MMKRKKKKLNVIKVFKTLCMIVGFIVIANYTANLITQAGIYMQSITESPRTPYYTEPPKNYADSEEYQELLEEIEEKRNLDGLGANENE